MPPRHVYWTIILEGAPTAFRAATQEELLPTLRQLQSKHPDAVLKWFARGKLWHSPEEARLADTMKRAQPRRPGSWRPGGDHKDPRDRFKVPRDVKRKRFAAKLRRDRFDEGGDQGDKPRRPKSEWEGRPRTPGGQGDRPRHGRPGGGRPGGQNRPGGPGREDRPGGQSRPGGQHRPGGQGRPGGQTTPGGQGRPGGPGKPWGHGRPGGGPGRPGQPGPGSRGGPGQGRPAGGRRPGGPQGPSRPERPGGGDRPAGGHRGDSRGRPHRPGGRNPRGGGGRKP